MFKIVVQQGHRRIATGGVDLFTARPKRAKTRSFPVGYVEDCGELRTKLATVFNTRTINIGGCSKRRFNKAEMKAAPQAYPLGYVEDADEPRTQLSAFFSIRPTLYAL